MWQRIQTLYLAISTALMAVLVFGNAIAVNSPDGLEYVRYTALAKPWMAVLLVITALVTVLALVTFKVRILQMRLAVIAGLLSLGLLGWLAWFYFTAPDGMVFRWTAIFPLVCGICDFLAARGAFQDQLIVESAYRVRESRRHRRK